MLRWAAITIFTMCLLAGTLGMGWFQRPDPDPGPTPTPTDITPVVLIHGMGGSFMKDSTYKPIKDALMFEGYSTDDISIPRFAEGGMFLNGMCIDEHIDQVSNAIDSLLAQTGAAKVDLVGHSRGAYIILDTLRTYTEYQDKVRKVISLAGATQWKCTGDPVVEDSTPGDIDYTAIYTIGSDGLLPESMTMLKDGAENIGVEGVNHMTFPRDDEVVTLVVDELLEE
jgi:pimeloyl-ACP methyl ester carboxylesterase